MIHDVEGLSPAPSMKISEQRRLLKLRKLLGDSFERIADAPARVRKQRRRDFAFHMSDWEADLYALAKILRSPGRYSKREFDRVLVGFLIHAPAHLTQAARLAEHYNDTFRRRPIISPTGRQLPPWSSVWKR